MRALIGGMWAGVASAAICYAEYVGLGAMLGSALVGYGDQSKAVGTLLVVLAAGIGSLVLGLRRLPMVAGPRGASLSILVIALLSLPAMSGQEQILAMAGLALGSAAMLYLGSKNAVQKAFDALPPWLLPAFIYTSAIAVVASATQKYLYSCLLLNEAQTWGIYVLGTGAGLGWVTLCKYLQHKAKSVALVRLLASLQGTSLVVGAGVSWLLYEHSQLQGAAGGVCARLGVVELQLQALLTRFDALIHPMAWQSTAWTFALACAWGLLVGMVLCVESRTTYEVLHDSLTSQNGSHQLPQHPGQLLRTLSKTNALMAPLTVAPFSISQARTQLIWVLSRPSAWAVVCHAVALLFIAFYGSRWLAWLPQIALAVLMTLVACSMVPRQMIDIWYRAHSPRRRGTAGMCGLWIVLGLTLFSGQVLVGFAAPAVWALCVSLFNRYRVRS